jgi:hemerythrin-like domain-containing protein
VVIAMGCDTGDMIMIHRVFRREFTALPRWVTAVPDGDLVRAGVVGDHVDLLLTFLHHHHEGEDELLWPLLGERAPRHGDVLAAMAAEHDELGARLDAVRDAARVWRAGAGATEGAVLADRLDALTASVVEHLAHEERAVLPLCATHVHQDEWNRLGERSLGALEPAQALLALAAMQEDSTEGEWAGFRAHLPPPVAAAYDAHGPAAYRTYIEGVRDVAPTGSAHGRARDSPVEP